MVAPFNVVWIKSLKLGEDMSKCQWRISGSGSICEKANVLKEKLTPRDSDTVSFFILFFEFNTILGLQGDFYSIFERRRR